MCTGTGRTAQSAAAGPGPGPDSHGGECRSGRHRGNSRSTARCKL
nr:hypothetical protein [uncultured Gemmiger sp.]